MGVFNWAIWKVVLPDNHSYQFHYTQYAEVARLDLPTGGRYEFDWVNGPGTDTLDICTGNATGNNRCPVIRAGSAVQAALGDNSGYDLLFAIYRRVAERREYTDTGSSWTRKTHYTVNQLSSGSDPFSSGQSLQDPLGQCGFTNNSTFVSGYCTRVNVADYDPLSGHLSNEVHYFYAEVSQRQSLFPQVGWYSWWLEGKEFRSDIRRADDVILRKQLQTWQPRAIPSWWQANPSGGPQPALDPRIGGSDLIIDGGKMARRLMQYTPDDTNNIADVYQYDFGSDPGSQGALLRRVHTDYVTTYNNVANPNVNAADRVYLRGLPSLETIYDQNGTAVAKTEYRYDESLPTPATGIVHNVPAPAQRGNITQVLRWRDTDGSNSSVPSWLPTTKTYDAAGNVLTVSNPLGDSTSYTYSDCSGMYAYVTTVRNEKNHVTTIGHDCQRGLTTSISDPNTSITNARYDDVLDRLTEISGPNGQHAVYAYSSDLTTVTTTRDQYLNPDQQMVSSVVTDGLGRTIATSIGNVLTRRDLDALGASGNNTIRAA
jgi:hypothetical protein